MPVVRLSGSIGGAKDPNRKHRAKLLYRLFEAGWDIYNGNGDQDITLGNIQKKIIESDAFVFCPGASLQDMFHATSIIVGHQTNDADLGSKPTVIQNSDGSWDALIQMINHLHELGTVKQYAEDFLQVVDRPREVVSILEENYKEENANHIPHPEPDICSESDCTVAASKAKPKFNVCVFCSASIKKEDYLQQGYDLGAALANEGWGCVSGAGRTGIMGRVVAGSVENGGWAGGSNVPHIIEMEGLPDGLTEFWPRGDIYTRMEIMIEESDAFVIMPGGTGTVQEVIALALLKQDNHDLMHGKEMVIVNRETDNGMRFWDPLIGLLDHYGMQETYHVVESSDQVIPKIKSIKNT